jgi:hypothetical protein
VARTARGQSSQDLLPILLFQVAFFRLIDLLQELLHHGAGLRTSTALQPIKRFFLAGWPLKRVRRPDLNLQNLANCTSALK